MIEQEKYTCLRLGDKAPEFEAQTTNGMIHFPSDFKGKWVILFSHPSDFTPVCTTEFILFSDMMKEFNELNTALVGLSVDSLSSHLAWLYSIQEQISFKGEKKVKIRFPLIADLSGEIARLYGMIHPNAMQTKTIRGVFFIDPKGIIRTILYYPQHTGRNFDELKRILISLQLNDALQVSTPANWIPGDMVVKSSPENIEVVEEYVKKNKDSSGAWYLSLEELSIKEIEKALHPKHKTK